MLPCVSSVFLKLNTKAKFANKEFAKSKPFIVFYSMTGNTCTKTVFFITYCLYIEQQSLYHSDSFKTE